MGGTVSLGPGGGSAPIDPRIRARRIEVRRRAGRRRLQRLIDVGVVLGVALVFVGALFTPLLDVDRIEVAGTTHLDAEAVAAASRIDVGSPLARLDLHAAGERVAQLSWVKEVRLDRRLDGTVRVHVTEREPVAVAGAGTAAVVVDVEGRVLARASVVSTAAQLPAVVGAPAGEPASYLADQTSDALVLAARLLAVAPGAVTAIEPDGLIGTLAQGGAVRFGDIRQLEAKLRSLRTVLDQVDLTCLAQIDLRLPGSPVLTRRSGCS